MRVVGLRLEAGQRVPEHRNAIPVALIEKHKYAPLTRSVKEQIFGLNAARVFSVDVNAARNEVPKDYLSRMKMAYLEDGAAPRYAIFIRLR